MHYPWAAPWKQSPLSSSHHRLRLLLVGTTEVTEAQHVCQKKKNVRQNAKEMTTASPNKAGPVIHFRDHYHDEYTYEEEEKKDAEMDSLLYNNQKDDTYNSKDKKPNTIRSKQTSWTDNYQKIRQSFAMLASFMVALALVKTLAPSTRPRPHGKHTRAYYTHPLSSKLDTRISWTMQSVLPYQPTYQETYNPIYQCDPGGDMDRFPLATSLEPKLWFRTTVTSSLRFLVMGDSVAMQMTELLQEAMGIGPHQRVVVRHLDDQAPHESLFWGTTGSGGGAGGWRILHWWLRRNQGRPLPEASGGGWTMTDVPKLLDSIRTLESSQGTATQQQGSAPMTSTKPEIDVLIFRVSQPWMSWESIHEIGMLRTISVAKELLNVKVVIFLTIPFSNNIVDKTDILTLHQKNDMIRTFVRNYPSISKDDKEKTEGVTVMMLDLAQLHDSVMKVHAESLGYTITPDYDFALDTLRQRADYYSQSIGHVCGERAPTGVKYCKHYNMITVDGQHLCMKTFGGRLFAGMACVTRCAYISNREHDELRECEQACNDQYMSLEEIDASMFAPLEEQDK